ncbi:hypothetical protein M409DRAFT_67903 [Zasmidium cellare ATCC 36951]|uniref:GA4 desaturase family protein n=1 Tax=Zasmidium cellare ATCC 36951 TaxID=1080233 RepID=A0A6A6CBI4_ZASCE|nr:uncharacterized protein M409DRAFT_67903 [Zasmidium cellare ATCC 36951]KAF2164391.1 hypothetical protein M409DRAFT_67903 [Zasmidium cellare ATCC 36951]
MAAVETTINYFDINEDRVFYPGTAGYQRRKFDTKPVHIHDLRSREDDFTLDKNGFKVLKGIWSEADVQDEPEHIQKVVFPETIEAVKKATGATDVLPFSHLVRRHLASAVKEQAQGLKDSDTVAAPGPTIFAHCDNSVAGAMTVLENNVPTDEQEKRRNSRWAIMNVWRPLVRPVTREPLALLDADTVDEKDLIGVMSIFPQKKGAAFGQAYPGGVGFETSQVLANENHRWYYASKLAPDEALLFKQFDSKKDGRARQTPHSAFQCKDDHGPPRESMEVRCLVFWEGESLS